MPRTREFIRDRLTPAAVPGCSGLRLYTAHERSGLALLELGGAPYWAWPWPGGIALARHLLAHPDLVRGRRVLDLGAGSGLVGIAAARAGAAEVAAAEIEPHARTAIALNAALNGVEIALCPGDLLGRDPPAADLVLAGDVFYEADLAAAALDFLRRAKAGGARVLLGDVGRPSLPRSGLRRIACYRVRDVGDGPAEPLREGGVYELAAPGGSDQLASPDTA